MRRAQNMAANAAKTPEEARHRLQLLERHILAAQVEARLQLRLDAPHERILSNQYVWNLLREVAVTWADQHRRTFGGNYLEEFMQRMDQEYEAILQLGRDSRRRPEYVRQLERRQHRLDQDRAQALADAMLKVERAQQALAELQERPRKMARADSEPREVGEPEEVHPEGDDGDDEAEVVGPAPARPHPDDPDLSD